MVIKKAQANFDNGTTYDVLHYETQVGQVKVMDAKGAQVSDLNEMLFNGKLLDAQDLDIIKTSGMYRVKGGTNLPISDAGVKIYILEVNAVDVGSGIIVTHQRFFDHINHEGYSRVINGATIGSWVKIGKSMVDQVAKIGNLTNLFTLQKDTVVNAINSVSGELVTLDASQEALKAEIGTVQDNLSKHNHDTKYLSLSGGSLTGSIAVANGSVVAGKNKSGANQTIGKVNATNDVVLGDASAKTIIEAKSGDISLSDGVTIHKLFHSGNDGTGSGLDADLVNGVEGSKMARNDVTNYLKGDQYVEDSKNVVLRAIEGSSQAGSLIFRDSANVQKGKIGVGVDGSMMLFGGTINSHTVRPNGELFSTYKHVLDSASRENRLSFQRGTTDAGAGLAMGSNGSFGMYDWQNNKTVFTLERSTGEVNFANAIKVNGKQLSITATAPASPAVGDVWIDI